MNERLRALVRSKEIATDSQPLPSEVGSDRFFWKRTLLIICGMVAGILIGAAAGIGAGQLLDMAVKPAVSLTGIGMALGMLSGGMAGVVATENLIDKKRPNL